jgi:hypothetical protein
MQCERAGRLMAGESYHIDTIGSSVDGIGERFYNFNWIMKIRLLPTAVVIFQSFFHLLRQAGKQLAAFDPGFNVFILNQQRHHPASPMRSARQSIEWMIRKRGVHVYSKTSREPCRSGDGHRQGR